MSNPMPPPGVVTVPDSEITMPTICPDCSACEYKKDAETARDQRAAIYYHLREALEIMEGKRVLNGEG